MVQADKATCQVHTNPQIIRAPVSDQAVVPMVLAKWIHFQVKRLTKHQIKVLFNQQMDPGATLTNKMNLNKILTIKTLLL